MRRPGADQRWDDPVRNPSACPASAGRGERNANAHDHRDVVQSEFDPESDGDLHQSQRDG